MLDEQKSKALDEIHNHAVILLEIVSNPEARDIINEIMAVARYKYPLGRRFVNDNDVENASE